MGVRVDVNCSSPGVMASVSQLTSFTIGGVWKLNADVLKPVAPLAAHSVLQERFDES